MGKIYDFTRLINKYSTDFTLITPSEGVYEGGVYKDGEAVHTALRGAIVPMSERKAYQSGGNYTAEDKELYMIKRINKALLGGKVLYKGRYYCIEEETDYSDFADAYKYVLRKEAEQ